MAVARKVGKDGTTRYYVVRMAKGKRTWMPGSYTSIRKAREADAALTVAKGKGQDIRPRRETVGALVDAWLGAKATSGKHRDRTQDHYRTALRTHVPDAFLDRRAVEVRSEDVQVILDTMSGQGLAPATIVKTRNVLSAAFNHAVRTGRLMVNPATNVEVPHVDRPTLRVPSGEQVGRILSASKGHPLHAPLVVAAYTGLRRAEVLALAWDDLDLDGGTLTVRRAVTFRGQTITFERPKTDSANRRVRLHPDVVDTLKAHRREQAARRLAIGPGWRDTLSEAGGLVFDNASGEPTHPNRLSLYFRRLVARLGMPGIRPHDLRHFAATSALRAGEADVVVSRMLGHSKTSTTKDLYYDYLPDDSTSVTEAIGRAITWEGR